MADMFPHLDDTQFPRIDTVDVYQYENNFDYKRYDTLQMTLTLCNVPWDMGEVHVGQRTVTGIGNVVYFDGGKAERDAWFAAIPEGEKTVFRTKFRRYHDDDLIKVPVPFDVCSKYNYCRVDYELAPTAENPVEYETSGGIVRWFYFIREVKYKAVNTTELVIKRDTWQTIIYDINIPYMVLERGHAPLHAVSADDYLTNPAEHTQYLMCEDVNYGVAGRARGSLDHVLNGSVYACVATSADPSRADWSHNTPATSHYTIGGAPTCYVFACAPTALDALLDWIDANVPQLKSTVQGVFFAPSDLIRLGSGFSLCGVTGAPVVYPVFQQRAQYAFPQLTTDLFGYEDKYKALAKLYTDPYAHLEITDETGNAVFVRIEDTGASITLEKELSLAFPSVVINGHLLGIGNDARRALTFANVDEHTFNVGGKWYDTLRTWDVPTFAVCQDAGTYADYATYFDRIQAKLAADNTYSGAVGQANAVIANGAASAGAILDNAELNVTCNTAVTNTSQVASVADTLLGNALNNQLNAWSVGYTNETVNNEVDAAYASAAIGAAGGAAQSLVGAITSAASGNIIGAAGSLANGAISGVTTMAQTSVAANLKSDQAAAANSYSTAKTNAQTSSNTDRNSVQVEANAANNGHHNDYITGAAANNAAVTSGNASRSGNAAINAASLERDTAYNAIDNALAQAGLEAPKQFGTFASGANATTRPQMLSVNVVTQADGAITMAGDAFLRYGYRYDGFWQFSGFNVMPRYTYWQCSDIWVKGLSIPDLYVDEVRFFLLGGVTVWRKPEYIGSTTIYENN